ncbi:MAG: hypothetical protein ACK4OM_05285 [Alphaproteobacteria bacterium]
MSKLTVDDQSNAKYVGLASAIASYSSFQVSAAILAITAVMGSDEFYSQAEHVHKFTSNIMGGAYIVGGAVLTPILGINSLGYVIGGICEITVSSIVIPTITNALHEYTHPHDDHIVLVGNSNDFDNLAVA